MTHWFLNTTQEWQEKMLQVIGQWTIDLEHISCQIGKWQEDIWLEESKGKLIEKEIDGELYYRKDGVNRGKISGLQKKIRTYIIYVHQISEAINELMTQDYKQAVNRDKDRFERRMKKLYEEGQNG